MLLPSLLPPAPKDKLCKDYLNLLSDDRKLVAKSHLVPE